MTEKQEKILHAALELFARDGFKITSTSKIAARAEVSEGLIFRHFKSKDGLLEAVIHEGEEKARLLFADVVLESRPTEVIRKTLDMVLNVSNNPEAFEFWKLQYKIKWETEKYNEHKLEPVLLALTNAFSKLGYESPATEATLLLVLIDGLATRLALQKDIDIRPLVAILKTKYRL